MLNAREKREWPKSSLGKDTFHVCHVLSFYEVCAGADTKLLLSKRLKSLRFLVVFTFIISFLLLYLFLDGKEDQRKVEEQIGDTYCTVIESQTRLFYELIKLSSFLFVC